MRNSIDEVLSINETSQILGLGRMTLFRLRKKGKGPKWIRLTEKRIGYRRSDVSEWLREREG